VARERLSNDGALEGEPVLHGYRLPVSVLFGWLKVPIVRPAEPDASDHGATAT
jgi:hypothetical protein